MGLASKLIAKIEEQAEKLVAYRQLDDRTRARTYELEGQLVKANAERDKALSDVQHWKAARDTAIEGGELLLKSNQTLQAEILHLRQQLAEAQQQQVMKNQKSVAWGEFCARVDEIAEGGK